MNRSNSILIRRSNRWWFFVVFKSEKQTSCEDRRCSPLISDPRKNRFQIIVGLFFSCAHSKRIIIIYCYILSFMRYYNNKKQYIFGVRLYPHSVQHSEQIYVYFSVLISRLVGYLIKKSLKSLESCQCNMNIVWLPL